MNSASTAADSPKAEKAGVSRKARLVVSSPPRMDLEHAAALERMRQESVAFDQVARRPGRSFERSKGEDHDRSRRRQEARLGHRRSGAFPHHALALLL